LGLGVLVLLLTGCESCLKRKPVGSFERLDYPTCPDAEAMAPRLLAEGVLRSGPAMNEQGVVERYRLEQRDCLYALTVRQEWPRQVTDVEVVYDEAFRPLRAWKRMALPGADEASMDTRLYEFRGEHPRMIRQSADGTEYFRFEGPQPIAVIAPGRAMVMPWLRSSPLGVGEIARGPVFDLRELIERQEEGQLRRDPDREDPTLGHVRVYTFYGRETVFTDGQDEVLGDLSGLLESSHVQAPMPPASPSPTLADPVHTP